MNACFVKIPNSFIEFNKYEIKVIKATKDSFVALTLFFSKNNIGICNRWLYVYTKLLNLFKITDYFIIIYDRFRLIHSRISIKK